MNGARPATAERPLSTGPGPTLVRYWGSYLKSPAQAERLAGYFTAVAAAGWRSVLVCCQPPSREEWLRPLSDIGVEIRYLPRARGNFDLRCIRGTRRLCADVRPDILHCDNTHTSPLIGAWMAGVPVRLWTKHAMQPAYEAMRKPTLRDRLAPSVRVSVWAATAVLPISRAIAAELTALGVPRRRLREMPLPHSAPLPTVDRATARARFACPPGALVIGTIGRAIPVKGWDVLLSAFAEVRPRLPAARLLLVGSSSAADERGCRSILDRMVIARGLEGAVIWAGHLIDPSFALRAMDLFVLPSRSEGFSLALIEALAAGVPAVSTRVGIAPDVITDGDNGLLVDRNDVVALAAALLAAGANPERLRRMSAAAAKPLRGVPTPADHAAGLLALYEELLSRRASGDRRRPPV